MHPSHAANNGDGAEGANFWLSVITDLQARGVEDIFIVCIDGLTGFKEAIHLAYDLFAEYNLE